MSTPIVSLKYGKQKEVSIQYAQVETASPCLGPTSLEPLGVYKRLF